MKASQGSLGRVFTLRLEDGERLPDTLETFCKNELVTRGLCLFIGGVKSEGKLVVGPDQDDAMHPVPMISIFKGVHEILGVGTIFPDENGVPRLHAHASLGRGGNATVGCIRKGVEAWKILEIIIMEIAVKTGMRMYDPTTEFSLLDPLAEHP